ncbi:30S ribosome-binding factor RbfA [uncultured Phenylobacterium sp.]|uniref:30S ribosome-binding factor RbfA n=1 Tax=uncultured Phenylobacterium sp. TaxID=349273 RepID=UPI0025FAB7C8|nr:30S ribosome-binding factor RbfA [uncultured Phenylobacterium sp.]
MSRPPIRSRPAPKGPSQRQLRAGELVRHALVDIFREEEINDPVLKGVSVTVTEVRMGPDLRHAMVFVEPLGGENADDVVKALNRHVKFIRGHLGRMVDLRFTPDLHFRHDETFSEAARMARLFDDPKVRQDLTPDEPSGSWKDED